MADPLCGPSNSLQVLQKHVSTDRAFQQDRVLSRHSPLEGFRSSKFPEPSVLEAEFEAFQAAPAFTGEFSGYEALESETARNPLIRHLPEPNLPSWALDFQALQVNEFQTSPLPSSEFREQAPLHLTSHKGRHPQFGRQGSPALVAQESHRQTQVRAPVRRINEIDYNIINHYYNSTPTPGLQNIQSGHQMEELFDDDALRQAFDAAEQSIDELAEVPQQGFQLHAQDAVTDQAPEILTNGLASRLSLENVLGSEWIPENTSKAEHVARDENELARTAGELLDKFKYEKNPKFENSSFLTLMRQLRDREVHVEGDRLVDAAHPLHPGGQFYPYRDIPDNEVEIGRLHYNDTVMTGAINNDQVEA